MLPNSSEHTILKILIHRLPSQNGIFNNFGLKIMVKSGLAIFVLKPLHAGSRRFFVILGKNLHLYDVSGPENGFLYEGISKNILFFAIIFMPKLEISGIYRIHFDQVNDINNILS